MFRSLTAAVAAACLSLGMLAGCVPKASVVVRNLSGQPLPAGEMAMLPPILSSEVEYETLATSFLNELLLELRNGGIPVRYTDLGGVLKTKTVPPQQIELGEIAPGDAGTQPAHDSLWEMLRRERFSTAVQPVVRRYGTYSVYVPARVRDYDGCGVGYGVGWGWPYRHGASVCYRRTVVPAHYEPGSAISVEFHVFDLQTGKSVHYILAESSRTDGGPASLEKGFAKPLVDAFRKAMRRPHEP